MEQSLHPNPRGLRGCRALGVDRLATLDPVEVLQSAVFLENQGCDAAKKSSDQRTFNVVVVGQNGRLGYEALLFAASQP